MAKKSVPIYMTDEQYEIIKRLKDEKYPHISFYGMIVDIVVKHARRVLSDNGNS